MGMRMCWLSNLVMIGFSPRKCCGERELWAGWKLRWVLKFYEYWWMMVCHDRSGGVPHFGVYRNGEIRERVSRVVGVI